MRDHRQESSERGAVLVHVALALLTLISFATFVVDYGVLWTARNQAQNAADSAALAGAVSLAFDNSQQVAVDSANSMLQGHWIWGQPPVVNPSDIAVSPCPDDPTQTCVKVDVFRNQARGNPLPMFFGSLLGLNNQGVRATATAKVFGTNSSDCLKPWGVADKWAESAPPWSATATFNPSGAPPDDYTAPSASGPGTGFNPFDDYGRQLQLKLGQSGDVINGGWYQPVNLDHTGATFSYGAIIAECIGPRFRIGDTLPLMTALTYPTLVSQTISGVAGIMGRDPGASWDPTANGGIGGVINSCVQNTPPCVDSVTGQPYRMSPRVVTVPVFDLDLFMATGGPGAGTVMVVNMLGFFVTGMAGTNVTGHLVTKPGVQLPGAIPAQGPMVFTRFTSLIR